MNDLEREVWKVVEELNRCWTSGDPADVADYFRETMIAITPSDRVPLIGRDACISAWTKYAQSTRILSWQTSDPHIRIYGHTAVVTYLFEMECERDGKRIYPSGRDMMVLVKDKDRWWLVADQFSPYPGQEDL